MSQTLTPTPVRENSILAALPAEEMERCAPLLTPISLALGQVIYEPNETIRRVYFPTSAVASIVIIMEDGSTVEAGMIGSTGMVGIPIILGAEATTTRVVIQHSGDALVMQAEALKELLRRGGRLQQSLLLFTHELFTQVSQTAACNRLHTVEERLARWLLMMHDLARDDEFLLTQEFIATMLGSRRAGVTVAAGILQQAGLLNYRRGRIVILDREGLEEVSCECYRIVKEEYDRYLNA
jgi:CRP-like cAMP-binding protein